MKQIVASKVVDIPDDVKFEVKARSVRVKGARGAQLATSGEGLLMVKRTIPHQMPFANQAPGSMHSGCWRGVLARRCH